MAVALVALGVGVVASRGLRSRPTLQSVGPRLVSNQTSQPLGVVGTGLKPGVQLRVGDQLVPLEVVDDRHAYGRLQPMVLPAAEPQRTFQAALEHGEGSAPLTVVNDAAFPDLTALAVRADGHVFAASTTTDELFELDPETGAVSRHATFDGPTALAVRGSTVVVAHRFDRRLQLWGAAGRADAVPAAANAEGVVVDPLGVAYVAEDARDTVLAVDLQSGTVLWRREVDPNPKALALAQGTLAVGSLQTGEVELLATDKGERQAVIAPRPGTPILGGGTASFSKYVMGGKAQRGLAFASGHLFSANSGPNVGPNPTRMEVSANGGVSELDPRAGTVLRHRGFGAGVTSAVAADEAAGVLYAADPALGLVRVLDLKTLELKQELPIPAPDGFPAIRPASELGVSGRAGPELHSGPTALALDGARKRLWVLDRFTGTAAAVDVSAAAEGKARLTKQWPLTDTLGQRERRLGQVLYFADVGRTSMSCDGCHLEGHTEGVFFEKTHPLRIYRSTTVRGSRETPPYFTPASTFSLAQTAKVVGGRNRYHNPDPSPFEVEALALYTAGITTLPNPFVGADGAPLPGELELFDHQRGRPREGLKLFEAHCRTCHPPPHFTTDQDPKTRGQYLDVGTPEALPLRVDMQELVGQGMAPPSLLGAWDIFPMLSSGSAGLKVVDGERLEVGARFALRDVVETHGGPRHGGSAALTAQERNDLLAYLLSL